MKRKRQGSGYLREAARIDCGSVESNALGPLFVAATSALSPASRPHSTMLGSIPQAYRPDLLRRAPTRYGNHAIFFAIAAKNRWLKR